jgi:hypothetical protein
MLLDTTREMLFEIEPRVAWTIRREAIENIYIWMPASVLCLYAQCIKAGKALIPGTCMGKGRSSRCRIECKRLPSSCRDTQPLAGAFEYNITARSNDYQCYGIHFPFDSLALSSLIHFVWVLVRSLCASHSFWVGFWISRLFFSSHKSQYTNVSTF